MGIASAFLLRSLSFGGRGRSSSYGGQVAPPILRALGRRRHADEGPAGRGGFRAQTVHRRLELYCHGLPADLFVQLGLRGCAPAATASEVISAVRTSLPKENA